MVDTPPLTSGNFKGTADELRAKIVEVVRMSAIQGWANAYGEYYRLVAKDKGRLRIGFNKAGRLTITSQRGSHEIRFNRDEVYAKWISNVPYAEHHQEVGPTGLDYYKMPTTPGTKPFKWKEFKPVLQKHNKMAFKERMQQAGLMRRG